MIGFDVTDEPRLLEQTLRQWPAREILPDTHEGTREIHKLMQADYLLGCRVDRPTRCELPPYKG